jgi:hypothetical protein
LIQIYELLDPETQAVRYIGQSRAAVKRLRWHLWAATAGRPYRVYRWIRSLTSRGLTPIMSILENCPEDDADAREQFWISNRQVAHRS